MDFVGQVGAGGVFALVFATIFLAASVVVEIILPKKREPGQEDSPETAFLSRAFALTSAAAAKRGLLEVIQGKVDRAGLPLRAAELIFFHIAGVTGAGLLAAVLSQSILVVILFVFIGAVLPLIAVQVAHARRQSRFHAQLPDTLTLISGALKAGYSFMQSVDMVIAETPVPMSEEFKRVLAEAQLGLPVEQALDHMAERVDSTNFSWTVMAVKIQREVGGNLAEVLETLAGTIRERDTVTRQIKTLTAEGRMSALILYILPFAVAGLLFMVNPGYISVMFTNTIGIMMLGVSGIMMIVGGVWLKKIVSIEV